VKKDNKVNTLINKNPWSALSCRAKPILKDYKKQGVWKFGGMEQCALEK
jgi:hypothetical protein